MFNYYGSKSKISRYYPIPMYNIVIEPFAGAAWYSVLHFDKKVILNDLNPTVYGIWKWLITEDCESVIKDNADFWLGQDISGLNLPNAYKDLIGFCINRGSSQPCNIVQKWSCQSKKNPEWASSVHYRLMHIASMIPKIKHWEIYNLDYSELSNIHATWFIDPPYCVGGHAYPQHTVNYENLAVYSRSRCGQVIVCEMTVLHGFRLSHL